MLSVLLALDDGAEARKPIKKKIKYSDLPPGDDPIGELEIIEDFLPSPDKLVFKQERQKVTISLSCSSLEFFKKQAAKHNVQYQKIIRNLLDEYVARHNK